MPMSFDAASLVGISDQLLVWRVLVVEHRGCCLRNVAPVAVVVVAAALMVLCRTNHLMLVEEK